jgi:hypothetical protein
MLQQQLSRLPELYIFWAKDGPEYVQLYFPADKRDCGLRPLESVGTMRRALDLQYNVKFYDMYLEDYLAR